MQFNTTRYIEENQDDKTWFCKSKLCQVCNWRRSMKNAVNGKNLEQSLNHISKDINKLKKFDWFYAFYRSNC